MDKITGKYSKEISRDETYILKGIAILTVIIVHANGISKSLVNIPVLKNGTLTIILCRAGMSLFLVLSGYGLYSSYLKKGLNFFWRNKFIKIFAPEMLVQSIWFVISTIITYMNCGNVAINWSTLFMELLCISRVNGIDGSMWYLSYLLCCYICFYLIFYIWHKRILE